MLTEHLRRIAVAQGEWGRLAGGVALPGFADLVTASREPRDVVAALLKCRPALNARNQEHRSDTSPQGMREEAAATGMLAADPRLLTYRRLFPTLDEGIYCAHHAMGKPSSALVLGMEEHLGQLFHHGIGAWEQGGWALLRDAFRSRVAEVCGADLDRGDVVRFENFSDALSALLGGATGSLLSGADHFTAGRYVHSWWAHRTGAPWVELEGDQDEWVPTERYIDALTPQTGLVSISTCHWRTGRMHDLPGLAEAMVRVCPEAMLLVDVYQSLGTVPFDIATLPACTAVMGGGIKQLHAGTGAGFAWISNEALDRTHANRTGWFAHARPFDFAPPPLELAEAAAGWQTGTPDVTPMAAIVLELDVLSTLGDGSLAPAIAEVDQRRRRTIARAIEACRAAGLAVVGTESADQRGAFFGIRVSNGEPLVAALAERGVTIDYRPDGPEADQGLIRMSTAAAAFEYELLYAVECLVAALRQA